MLRTTTALILAIPTLTYGEEPMGPPAPSQGFSAHFYEVREAERAWRWYAGAWAINTVSTIAAVRNGGQESNPIFRTPERAIAAKGVAATLAWRSEVYLASHGHDGWAKGVRWFWVGLSGLVAGWEFRIAF